MSFGTLDCLRTISKLLVISSSFGSRQEARPSSSWNRHAGWTGSFKRIEVLSVTPGEIDEHGAGKTQCIVVHQVLGVPYDDALSRVTVAPRAI